jgi:hypothetical protein
MGKASQAAFLRAGLLLERSGPSLRMRRHASRYRITITDSQGPPVGVVFPQFSPLALRPRGNADKIATAKPATRHHLRTAVTPLVRPCPGAIASPPRVV